MPARDTPIGEMFAKLATEPTIENFLMFIQLAYAFGFPSDARESALKAVQSPRNEIAVTPPDHAQAVLDRRRETETAVICPTGKSVSSPSRKNISLNTSGKSLI